jgi:hypothetical protein
VPSAAPSQVVPARLPSRPWLPFPALPALAPEGETEGDGDGDSEGHSPGDAKPVDSQQAAGEGQQEASEQTAPQPPCVSLDLLEEALKREAVAAGLRCVPAPELAPS